MPVNPATQTGLPVVNIAYIVFQKVPIFHESLIRLNKKTDNKTYNDFKIYIGQKYNELTKAQLLRTPIWTDVVY